MRLQKTWLSYIVWGMFSVIFFADIGIAAIEICQKNDGVDFMLPIVSMYIYTFLGVALLVGLYKLYEKIIMPKLDGEVSVLQGALEIFAFVLFMLVSCAIRAIIIIAATQGLEGGMEYYEYAISSVRNFSLETYSNGAYIYSGFLGFVLSFLGHIPRAAMGVQAFLEVLTIGLTYFTVKKALGRMPAWIAIALMSFLPGSFMQTKSCGPDALFTLFFAIFMFCLVYLCEANKGQYIKNNAQMVFYLLMGVFAAWIAYYDIVGLLVVVIGIIAFIQSKSPDAWMPVQRPWFQNIIFLSAFAVSFVLFVWFLPLNGLSVGPEALIGYFTKSMSVVGYNIMILSPHKGYWDSLALFILAGVWFVGFLRDKKDKALFYALAIVILTVFSFLNIGNYEYTAFSSYVWILLAAIGLTSLDAFAKREEVEERKKVLIKNRKGASKKESIGISLDKEEKTDSEKRNNYSHSSTSYVQEQKQNINSNIGMSKGYGIGRKETAKTESNASDLSDVSSKKSDFSVEKESVKKEVSQKMVEYTAKTEVVPERPDVNSVPIPKPVESKPAYSYGSPSRRHFRTPSRSTFTAEELAKIRQFTGMNEETVTTGTNNTIVQKTPVTYAQEPSIQDIHSQAEQKTAEPVENTEVRQIVRQQEAPTEGKAIVTNEAQVTGMQTASKYSAGTEAVSEKQGESDALTQKPVESKPAYSYGSPSRRPIRHPSKSTFSQEELIKIREFTGMDIKISETASEDKTVNEEKIETKANQSKTQHSMTQPSTQSASQQPKLIRNPLPGPKPHVPKELNYDYQPKESELKFDIEDLRGKDFYDI